MGAKMIRCLVIFLLAVITLQAGDPFPCGIKHKKPPVPAPLPPPPSPPPPPPPPKPRGPECVIGGYIGGRLGNQLFQISATLSLAMDHNVVAIFPEWATWELYDIPENLKQVFFRLSTAPAEISTTFQEDENFVYKPIPYTPNIHIRGFFQSEKYFKHNKEKILPLFEPRQALADYLNEKYAPLIKHPCTVGVHLRAYKAENPAILNAMVPITIDYVKKAATLFPEEAHFVIFTDHVPFAQDILSTFDRPYTIIENESQFADLYLLSYMKHQIISNSSFSWWAAYLNKNRSKIVVAPLPWFQPHWHNAAGNNHIIPEGWYTVNPYTLEIRAPY